MPHVYEVKLFGTLRVSTEAQRYTAEAETAADILRAGVERFGRPFEEELLDASGGLRPGVILLVDGQNVHGLQGLDTTLPEGADIALFPPSAGG